MYCFSAGESTLLLSVQ